MIVIHSGKEFGRIAVATSLNFRFPEGLAINKIKIALLISVGILLQTSLPSALFQRALAGNQPDFLLILTLFLSMTAGPYTAAVIGFISGFLLDCFATQLGINAFNLLVFGYVTGLCARRIFFDNLLSQSLCIFILTLVSKILLLGLTIIHVGSAMILPLDSYLARHWYFLPSAFLNVALARLIFRFLQKPYIIRNYDEQQVERDDRSVKSEGGSTSV